MAGAIALHAAAFLTLAQLAAGASGAPAAGASVRVSLVSGGSPGAPHEAASTRDPLARQLEELSRASAGEAAAHPAASAPSANAPGAGALDELLSHGRNGVAEHADGHGQTAGAQGAGVKDPYARAALSADPGATSAAPPLRDQIMACWMGPPVKPGVDVEVVLGADGALKRPPTVRAASRQAADGTAAKAALGAVSDCAPYQIGGRAGGVFVIRLG